MVSEATISCENNKILNSKIIDIYCARITKYSLTFKEQTSESL